MINYNTTYSKTIHKYFFKSFYNKTIKKEYESQTQQHNVRHTNIIGIKDVIISEKLRKKEILSGNIANIIILAKPA